jgi:hypothetical protein
MQEAKKSQTTVCKSLMPTRGDTACEKRFTREAV